MKIVRSNILKTLFIDIETVAQKSNFGKLSPSFQNLWTHKANQLNYVQEANVPYSVEDAYVKNAAFYPEFGRIVCISIGMFIQRNTEVEFVSKSFYADNERGLIKDFLNCYQKYFNHSDRYKLCGHNVIEFIIPFIGRRSLIHGLKLPSKFNLMDRKPWQLDYVRDTLSMWKFGAFKNAVSLETLCTVFDIDTQDIFPGEDVHRRYWEEQAYDEIMQRSKMQIRAVACLYSHLCGVYNQVRSAYELDESKIQKAS